MIWKIVLSLILLSFTTIWFVITTPIFAASYKPLSSQKANKDTLYKHVKFLTSTALPRNYLNLEVLDSVTQYIQNEFNSYGYVSEKQTFKIEGIPYSNVLASYGPKDAPRLIIGAHYDVCGEQDGADDNASGIAGLLELARLLQLQKPDLKYRIDFVAYTLEEPPFFRSEFMGSAVHAKSINDAKVEVLGMICLEMIGYFSDKPKSQEYPIGLLKLFYPTVGNYITVVGKIGQGKILRMVKSKMIEGSKISVKSINAPSIIPGIDFSDHQNYWKYDFDAVMITNTAFYRNMNYHQVTDTIETLDFDRMTEVVNGVYNAILGFGE